MKNEELKHGKKHLLILFLHSAFCILPLPKNQPHFSVFICSFGMPKPWMTSSSAKSTSAFGTAGVENRVGQVGRHFLDRFRRNAPVSVGRVVLGCCARTGDVEFKMRVFLFQLAEFVVENNVVCRADTVEDGYFCGQLPPRRLPRKRPKRRHARTAGDADQVLVRFEDGRNLPVGGITHILSPALAQSTMRVPILPSRLTVTS